jgi:hypothetical protein
MLVVWPVAQLSHDPDTGDVDTLPIAHFSHWAPSVAYSPAAQATQASLAALAIFPAAHKVQSAAPEPEILPTPQPEQSLPS